MLTIHLFIHPSIRLFMCSFIYFTVLSKASAMDILQFATDHFNLLSIQIWSFFVADHNKKIGKALVNVITLDAYFYLVASHH